MTKFHVFVPPASESQFVHGSSHIVCRNLAAQSLILGCIPDLRPHRGTYYGDILVQMGIFPQVGGNEDASLLIRFHFHRTGKEEP